MASPQKSGGASAEFPPFVESSLFVESRFDESGLELVFRTGERSTTATITFAFSPTPTLRLKAVTLNTMGRDEQTGAVTPFGRKTFRIEKWQSFEGVEIPSVALFLQSRVDDRDGDGMNNVFIKRIKRQSIVKLTDETAASYVVLPTLAIGDSVWDECKGLRYEIGKHWLNVDGEQTSLRERILERITEQIPELLGEYELDESGRYRTVQDDK